MIANLRIKTRMDLHLYAKHNELSINLKNLKIFMKKRGICTCREIDVQKRGMKERTVVLEETKLLLNVIAQFYDGRLIIIEKLL